MNHTTLIMALNISLYLVLPIGMVLLFLWFTKIYKPLVKSLEKMKRISTNSVAIKVMIYMMPGLLIFVLFSVPAIYFNHLIGQEEYCQELITVNNFKKDHPTLIKRCGSLDIEGLFETIEKTKNSI